MENKRPLILISNDDGVVSKGISELVRFLRTVGDIVVVAPDMPRSGVSCAVTLDAPIHCQMVRQDVGLKVYRCSGTPTDCIKLAFYAGVLDREPDIVVSGINHGDNSSINSHYSGTMGAAREGCLRGIPSVAFSLCSHDPNADFEAAGPYIREIVQKVLERGLPPLTCLNVNFPAVAPLKGIRVCKQAKGCWNDEFEHFEHRGDSHYYWMTGDYTATDADNDKSDYWALANGYAAITPTTVDVTDHGFIDRLSEWFKEEE